MLRSLFMPNSDSKLSTRMATKVNSAVIVSSRTKIQVWLRSNPICKEWCGGRLKRAFIVQVSSHKKSKVRIFHKQRISIVVLKNTSLKTRKIGPKPWEPNIVNTSLRKIFCKLFSIDELNYTMSRWLFLEQIFIYQQK